jgi:flagellar biosynthesis protein FlhG
VTATATRDDQAAALRRIVDRSASFDRAAAPAILAPAPAKRGAAVRLSIGPDRPEADAPARVSARTAAPAPSVLARAIAVTSGKGGVGKSNLAVNLAVVLSQMGRRVCLLDADLGMANADVLCNLTPRQTLLHVVTGRSRLADVCMLAPGGFRLIPGASGVAGMADLGPRQRAIVLGQLVALEQVVDDIIIDCAAGISANVLAFAAVAHTTVVTTTPEPTAVTDAYGMVKCLVRQGAEARVELVVNMVEDAEEGRGVHERMDRVTRAFLGRSIGHGGSVPLDPAVAMAVRHRLPFTLAAPDAPATRAVRAIGRGLVGIDSGERRGRAGFFARVARWLGAGAGAATIRADLAQPEGGSGR